MVLKSEIFLMTKFFKVPGPLVLLCASLACDSEPETMEEIYRTACSAVHGGEPQSVIASIDARDAPTTRTQRDLGWLIDLQDAQAGDVRHVLLEVTHEAPEVLMFLTHPIDVQIYAASGAPEFVSERMPVQECTALEEYYFSELEPGTYRVVFTALEAIDHVGVVFLAE